MLKIQAIPVFNDNYIWIFYSRESFCAWAIDPGMSEPVISFCTQNKLTLSGILVTHHHFDHTGGIEELIAHTPVPVYGPENKAMPYITQSFNDGESLSLSVGNFKIISVPGHTLDHISYFSNNLIASNPVLFIGDTLFSAGCGRIFEGTAEQMLNSLKKISALPVNTLIYPAHEYTLSNIDFALTVEPDNNNLSSYQKKVQTLRNNDQPSLPTTLIEQLSINPFLRITSPTIIKNVSQWSGRPMKTNQDTFANLRLWKDNI